MKLNIEIDTENPEDDKELLMLSMNRKFFNFIFDMSLNFKKCSTDALGLYEPKDSYTVEEIHQIINFVLIDSGISHEVIEDLS